MKAYSGNTHFLTNNVVYAWSITFFFSSLNHCCISKCRGFIANIGIAHVLLEIRLNVQRNIMSILCVYIFIVHGYSNVLTSDHPSPYTLRGFVMPIIVMCCHGIFPHS